MAPNKGQSFTQCVIESVSLIQAVTKLFLSKNTINVCLHLKHVNIFYKSYDLYV